MTPLFYGFCGAAALSYGETHRDSEIEFCMLMTHRPASWAIYEDVTGQPRKSRAEIMAECAKWQAIYDKHTVGKDAAE